MHKNLLIFCESQCYKNKIHHSRFKIKALKTSALESQKAFVTACATYGITVEPGGQGSWASSNILTLTQGNQTQLLNPGGGAGTALDLEAASDFDGDGKTDLIISFDTAGWDLTVTYALFLSSEARPGELVRPVAVQYSYQGC